MAFQGVYIRLPEEVVELLDALSPHVGEQYPARTGRTSVVISLLMDGFWAEQYGSDPTVKAAGDRFFEMVGERPQ